MEHLPSPKRDKMARSRDYMAATASLREQFTTTWPARPMSTATENPRSMVRTQTPSVTSPAKAPVPSYWDSNQWLYERGFDVTVSKVSESCHPNPLIFVVKQIEY